MTKWRVSRKKEEKINNLATTRQFFPQKNDKMEEMAENFVK